MNEKVKELKKNLKELDEQIYRLSITRNKIGNAINKLEEQEIVLNQPVSQEILEEAADISVRAVMLEKQLNSRILLVGREGIKNLRDLYFCTISDMHIRGIGNQMKEEIKVALSDMESLVRRLQDVNDLMQKNDKSLAEVIDNDFVVILKKKYGITTVGQLYIAYTNNIIWRAHEAKVRRVLEENI